MNCVDANWTAFFLPKKQFFDLSSSVYYIYIFTCYSFFLHISIRINWSAFRPTNLRHCCCTSNRTRTSFFVCASSLKLGQVYFAQDLCCLLNSNSPFEMVHLLPDRQRINAYFCGACCVCDAISLVVPRLSLCLVLVRRAYTLRFVCNCASADLCVTSASFLLCWLLLELCAPFDAKFCNVHYSYV